MQAWQKAVDRLDLSLDIIEAVYRDPELEGYEGFGLALQAYQKRAPAVVDWLAALAKDVGRRIPVRLVKGAYWDTEVKLAQIEGLSDYPVYTRKINTDVAYLACARKLLAAGDAIYPQFATHNAYTISAVIELAGERTDYEFQRLHGMGEALYGEVLGAHGNDRYCRVYAPVGAHRELLPYLVRRLLENGANTSFVHRISDENTPVEEIIADPLARAEANESKRHPKIVLPENMYAPDRRNSKGINIADEAVLAGLQAEMAKPLKKSWRAVPIVGGKERTEGTARAVLDPADNTRKVGEVIDAEPALVEEAIGKAAAAQVRIDVVGVLCRPGAAPVVRHVVGAGRASPSGPGYRACQRPEGSLRTRPNRRRLGAIRPPDPGGGAPARPCPARSARRRHSQGSGRDGRSART